MTETIKTQIRKIKVRNDAFVVSPETLKDIDFKKKGVTTILLEADDPFPKGNPHSPLMRAFELREAKKLVERGARKFVSQVNSRIMREESQRNFIHQGAPLIKLTKLGFMETGAVYFSFSTKTGIPCTGKTNRTKISLGANVYGAKGKWHIFGIFIMYAEIENLIISNTKKNQAKYPELIGKDFYMWKELQF